MSLSQKIATEVGRLLNGRGHRDEAAIGHLAGAAARGAESLIYLASIDDSRFGGVWTRDGHNNDSVDDGHVRWAASGALACLDLCMAAAARLAGFAQRPPRKEDSIRDYYKKGRGGDKRHLVLTPWRVWVDGVVADQRYEKLLGIRNALVHGDALRIIHGTSGLIEGHQLRYGYRIGPLRLPVQASSHSTVMAREIVELSRDVALQHVGAFHTVLQAMP